MRKWQFIVFFFAFTILICTARSQELALKTSFRDPTFRMEAGKTVVVLEDLFSQTWFDVRIWCGAGATVNENSHLTGSFAGLVNIPISKSFRSEVGIEYRGEEGVKPVFDLVAHFSLNPDNSQLISLGPKKVLFGLKF